ncbi:MAG: 4Fe-4S binding protein, partial [Anaerolineaceae bacterium]
YGKDEVWQHLPVEVQKVIIEKQLKFYVVDGYAVAEKAGMGGRVNTIMQTCFFAISGILPREAAIEQIKYSIKKTYGKRGEKVVQANYAAVDASIAHLEEVTVPAQADSALTFRPAVPAEAPAFVKDVLGKIISYDGENVPVSAMPIDGTFPTGTTQWEKRNITLHIPVWDPSLCIQCGKCAFVCPHAAIRNKVYDTALLEKAPATFKSIPAKFKEFPGTSFTVQVAPEDCTGCGLCVSACPAKDKADP